MGNNKVGPASNITPKHGVRNPQSQQVKNEEEEEESEYEFESFEEEFEEEIEEEKAKPNTEGDNADSGSIKFTDVNDIQKTFRTGAQGTDMSKIKGLTLKSKKNADKLKVEDIYSDENKLSDKDDKAPSYYDEDEEYESEEAELEDEE